MTNREALEAFKLGKRLDQPTVRRLIQYGLITAEDATNFDSPKGEKEYLPIALTHKGHRLLERPRPKQRKNVGRKNRSWKVWPNVKRILPVFSKTILAIVVPVFGWFLYYKYTGAEDLRNKVYSPLNADLEKLRSAILANSPAQIFYGDAVSQLKQSGDFYRVPKSLQQEISKAYEDAGQYESNITPITDLIEREFSQRIERIRSEDTDRTWREETEARIRIEEEQKPGLSVSTSMTFRHPARGRGIDIRDPAHPIACIPGGPMWQINDWLSYSDSLSKIDSLWTDEDFLYFDDSRDMWYYRITRADLRRSSLTLKQFVDPVHALLLKDIHFNNVRQQQQWILARIEALRAKVAARMDDPKKISDLLQF